jgi:hypothetical protein
MDRSPCHCTREADHSDIQLPGRKRDDGNASPVAVVAGLTLQQDRFTWLDLDWQQAIAKHAFGKPYVHMKDFAPHGELRDLPESKRIALFSDLSKIIREYKTYSIEATLSTDNYKKHLASLAPISASMPSIYSACFTLMAIFQGKQAEQDKYKEDIPFVLDDGCAYEQDVVIAHKFLVNEFQPRRNAHVGDLAFGDDTKIRALQAADVIAWVVRRKRAGLAFRNGFEPLENVLDGQHLAQNFEEDWMKEIALMFDKIKS